MKRSLLCLVLITCFLLTVVTEHAVAETVTHSVSAILSEYTPAEPHTTVEVENPQREHLFDVTFDDAGTSYNTYDSDGNILNTFGVDELLVVPDDAFFVSNATFKFSPEMLNAFALLGINSPDEGSKITGFVAGYWNPTYPDGQIAYNYVFSFYPDTSYAPDNSPTPGTAIQYWTYSPVNSMSYGIIYDSFKIVFTPNLNYDWGNNALFRDTEYEIVLPDGTVGATGGTVVDGEFGEQAKLEVPAGAVQDGTIVNINVLTDDPDVPLPQGVSTTDSYFVNIHLEPEPDYPLSPPGMTVVLPLKDLRTPGTPLYLWRVHPDTGQLEPSIGVDGYQVSGSVDADGLSATFIGVARFSTVVGIPPAQVDIDVKPGSYPNCFNVNGNGVIPVAILGGSEFDVEDIKMDDTLSFNGLAVRIRGKKGPLCSIEYSNDDEFPDLVCHFEDDPELWIPGNENAATLTGELMDGTKIEGTDSICIVP